MNNITFFELLSFAKAFSTVFVPEWHTSMTKEEAKAAFEALKKMNENRTDWTQEQKEIYKAIADFAKEMVDNSNGQ